MLARNLGRPPHERVLVIQQKLWSRLHSVETRWFVRHFTSLSFCTLLTSSLQAQGG